MKKPELKHKKLVKSPHNIEMNKAAESKLLKVSRMDVESAYAFMESSKEGISQATADERISKFGLNEVAQDGAPSWFKQLVKSFVNPFIFILLTIGIISFAIEVRFAAPGERDFKTVIGVLIAYSFLIQYVKNLYIRRFNSWL